MIRVLHSVSNMDRGGIETMLMNYYRRIDRDKIQFDFICNKKKPGDYDDEIRSMGGRIFLSPGLNPVKIPEYMSFMKELLSDDSIKILHAHNEAMAYYALEGAKRAGLPVRIAHAHNTMIIRDYKWPLKMVCKALLPYAATDYWGCGTDAGIYYFGKKRWSESGHIMNNAIDLEKFAFDSEIRSEMRQRYGLDKKLVLGHVGRFNVQKNHMRLLEIFSAVLKQKPDSALVLIGEGELFDKVKSKASQLGISDSVILTGLCEEVEKWYMAMDAFVMPSLFEGLPVVGIEAQASGLPCIYSDKVTDEAVILDLSETISLSKSNEEWAFEIIKAAEKNGDRERGTRLIRKAGYDIVTETQKLSEIYLEMSERDK
ncbi:MAG: glycosyltransferase family 1 protein [Clostridiales bacterium]|nr:glycosyltransferase family 1 protein [Clostridiales bacterium]